MSTTLSDSKQVNTNSISENMVSLNQLFNETMKKFQLKNEKANIIVRCESLPEIESNEKELSNLLDAMLNVIFMNSQQASKLFLHVHCSEVENDKGKEYEIRFHTNVSTTAQWREDNKDILSFCKETAIGLRGNLAVNHVENTGCLFLLTLPGKLT